MTSTRRLVWYFAQTVALFAGLHFLTSTYMWSESDPVGRYATLAFQWVFLLAATFLVAREVSRRVEFRAPVTLAAWYLGSRAGQLLGLVVLGGHFGASLLGSSLSLGVLPPAGQHFSIAGLLAGLGWNVALALLVCLGVRVGRARRLGERTQALADA